MSARPPTRRAPCTAPPRPPALGCTRRCGRAGRRAGGRTARVFATGVLVRGGRRAGAARGGRARPAGRRAGAAAPTAERRADHPGRDRRPTAAPTTPAPCAGPKVFRAAASGLCVGRPARTRGRGRATGRLHRRAGAAVGGHPGRRRRGHAHQRGHGQCLDVEGGSGDDGAGVQQLVLQRPGQPAVAADPGRRRPGAAGRRAQPASAPRSTTPAPRPVTTRRPPARARPSSSGRWAEPPRRPRPGGVRRPRIPPGRRGGLSPGSSTPGARSRRPARATGTGRPAAAQQQRQPGRADRQRRRRRTRPAS